MNNHETPICGPRQLNLSLQPFQGLVDRCLAPPEETRLRDISSLLISRFNEQLPEGDTRPLAPKGFAVLLHNVLADCSLDEQRLEQDGTYDVPESLVGRVNNFNIGLIAHDILLLAAAAYGHGFASEVNDTYRITQTDTSFIA